jgi:hypothetical protein
MNYPNKPLSEWDDEELTQWLALAHTAEPVPRCPVCDGALVIGSIGLGPTRWHCQEPGHYAQSGWSQHKPGDEAVLELVRRYQALQATTPTTSAQCDEEEYGGYLLTEAFSENGWLPSRGVWL